MGKMMEQGPVLVITFNSQQILAVKDSSGKVIEGSDDKVIHDWRAMQCADQVSAGYRIQIYPGMYVLRDRLVTAEFWDFLLSTETCYFVNKRLKTGNSEFSAV